MERAVAEPRLRVSDVVDLHRDRRRRMAAYATSKVAVEQLAHVLHLELAHTGIGVGTVYASWIDSPLIANAESAMPSFARLRRPGPGPPSCPA